MCDTQTSNRDSWKPVSKQLLEILNLVDHNPLNDLGSSLKQNASPEKIFSHKLSTKRQSNIGYHTFVYRDGKNKETPKDESPQRKKNQQMNLNQYHLMKSYARMTQTIS